MLSLPAPLLLVFLPLAVFLLALFPLALGLVLVQRGFQQRDGGGERRRAAHGCRVGVLGGRRAGVARCSLRHGFTGTETGDVDAWCGCALVWVGAGASNGGGAGGQGLVVCLESC